MPRKSYPEKLERIDGWLFDRMANRRLRVIIDGEVSIADLSVCASLFEYDGDFCRHVRDGFGETPLDAMEDLIESVENAEAEDRTPPAGRADGEKA